MLFVCIYCLFPDLPQYLLDDDSRYVHLCYTRDYLGPPDNLQFYERLQKRSIIFLCCLPIVQYFEHAIVLKTKSKKFLNGLIGSEIRPNYHRTSISSILYTSYPVEKTTLPHPKVSEASLCQATLSLQPLFRTRSSNLKQQLPFTSVLITPKILKDSQEIRKDEKARVLNLLLQFRTNSQLIL